MDRPLISKRTELLIAMWGLLLLMVPEAVMVVRLAPTVIESDSIVEAVVGIFVLMLIPITGYTVYSLNRRLKALTGKSAS